MEKLTFLGLLNIFQEMFKKELLQRDPDNLQNMFVYRKRGSCCPAGWYSENIHTVASELLQDKRNCKYVLNRASKAGIDTQNIMKTQQ